VRNPSPLLVQRAIRRIEPLEKWLGAHGSSSQTMIMNSQLSGRRILVVEDEPLLALDYPDEFAECGAHPINLIQSRL
jgi:hypothetical protein